MPQQYLSHSRSLKKYNKTKDMFLEFICVPDQSFDSSKVLSTTAEIHYHDWFLKSHFLFVQSLSSTQVPEIWFSEHRGRRILSTLLRITVK